MQTFLMWLQFSICEQLLFDRNWSELVMWLHPLWLIDFYPLWLVVERKKMTSINSDHYKGRY